MNDQFSTEQLVQSELNSGERLLWSGAPNPFRHLWRGLPLFLFSIPWTAFAIFWIYGASGFQTPDFSQPLGYFPLFGVPFVLIGLGMMLSPLYYYYSAKRTVYVLTDKRALVIKFDFRKSVTSYSDEDIETIQRKEKTDGSGDLMFGQEISRSSRGRTQTTPLGFFGIQNVRHVEKLFNDTFKKS